MLAASTPIIPRNRQAILRVSIPLLETFQDPEIHKLTQWLCYGMVLNADVSHVPECFHKALLLPQNCVITGATGSLYFDKDAVAFRIACPDFVEIPEGATLPEVRALYVKEGGKVRFLRWDGPAVKKVCGSGEVVPPTWTVEDEFGRNDPGGKRLSGLTASPCWQCSTLTSFRLSDGTAECQACSAKPLL